MATPADECSICFKPFEVPLKTKCEHTYCMKCIQKWLRNENTCPMCRKVLFKKPPTDRQADEYLRIHPVPKVQARSDTMHIARELRCEFLMPLAHAYISKEFHAVSVANAGPMAQEWYTMEKAVREKMEALEEEEHECTPPKLYQSVVLAVEKALKVDRYRAWPKYAPEIDAQGTRFHKEVMQFVMAIAVVHASGLANNYWQEQE